MNIKELIRHKKVVVPEGSKIVVLNREYTVKKGECSECAFFSNMSCKLEKVYPSMYCGGILGYNKVFKKGRI